ncbi:MAG: type III secretion system export apparatus subunit SctV [Planctomycetaceae bacterium]|nr:type III secretion system export apparatus subunit SctV [Planctomycetaceae bacterium]
MSGSSVESLVIRLTRYNDLILALLVVAIIALMILPLPTFLVDALLATNLGLAVTLLMMSMYINSVLAFSTFPSMLLFTTLLRLAMNITTTRLILIQADAGEVIETFGQFVVGGNLIVGVVVFLIITIVQFLVIAKGSERVAEVAARFTLDAMPGKQMSIDADMRAGVIDLDQAKARRSAVEKENQLYGAMDGAMKFVKGDAIAGLIITAINIVGGISIGVLQRDMEVGKALETYSLLTIGDGLVSQIPALLISMTAGIIVTRVSTDESTALGGDIGSQILAQPKALMIAGVLLLLFALIPGFPKAQFVLLGLMIGTIGFAMKRLEDAGPVEEGRSPMSAASPTGAKRTQDADELSLTVPLILDVPSSLEKSLVAQKLNAELARVRQALYNDLGVPFPGIHLRYNKGIAEGTYRILLNEIPVASGEIRPDRVLVREQADNLQVLGIPFEEGEQFLPDVPSFWVDMTHAEKLRQAGVPVLDPSKIFTHHLAFVLKRYASEFIGLQETKLLLDNAETRFPEVVKEVQRVLPVPRLAEILQRLVQEEVSIRNLRTILQALIEWAQKEKDPVLLVEYVRSSLKRYLSYKYSGGQNMLSVYLLEPGIEDAIRKAIRQTSGGSYLALDPTVTRKFTESVRLNVGDISQMANKPVLLTTMDIRRYVKKLVEGAVPDMPVLSYQELTEEITIQPLAKISL